MVSEEYFDEKAFSVGLYVASMMHFSASLAPLNASCRNDQTVISSDKCTMKCTFHGCIISYIIKKLKSFARKKQSIKIMPKTISLKEKQILSFLTAYLNHLKFE